MAGYSFTSKRVPPPYIVASVKDLPVSLQELAQQALNAGETPTSIFVIPQQMVSKKLEGLGGMRRVPDQALLFTTDGLHHIMAGGKPGQPGQIAYLRADSLIYAHLRLILLYGRLELCGTKDDALTQIVIEYNAVSHFLIQPALHRFLRLSWGQPYPAKTNNDAASRFRYEIRNASYKYRRGLEDYAIQAGEGLIGCVLQPPITKRLFKVIRLRIAPPVMLALTQHQLIVIEEGMTSATSLGWYFTFCPRDCVTGFEFMPNIAWQDMYIHLSKGNVTAERRTKVEKETAQDWQAFWSSQQSGL
jgi:hypothetical protein